jgi:tRNA A37 methylthiotransferase MiaB
MLFGRTDGNKTVIIPLNDAKPGDRLMVKINRANSATLFGEAVSVN